MLLSYLKTTQPFYYQVVENIYYNPTFGTHCLLISVIHTKNSTINHIIKEVLNVSPNVLQ